MNFARNCLSYWFPKLEATGIPVPKTRIVRYPASTRGIDELLDGKMPEGWQPFMAELGAAVQAIGLPCFLRTGQTSGKHRWDKTCHLTDMDELPYHVWELVEHSAMVDIMSLPADVWCVREMLPTRVICKLPAYENMPLAREFRFFVAGGAIACSHSYWPSRSIAEGFPFDADDRHDIDPDLLAKYTALAHGVEGIADAQALALKVAQVFQDDGAWSVDVLECEGNHWFVTDMATAAESFHWEGCPNGRMFANQERGRI